MGDPLWSDRLLPVLHEAIPLLANLIRGELLDTLLSKKCIDDHHYSDLFEAHKRESAEATARSLIIILRRKPKPFFTTFCDVLLKLSGGAGQDLCNLLTGTPSSKQTFAERQRHDLCRSSQQLVPATPSSRSGDTTLLHRVSSCDEKVTIHVDVTKELEERYDLHRDSFIEALKIYLREAIPKPLRIVERFPATVRARNTLRVAELVQISIMFPNIDRRCFEQEEKDFVEYIAGIMKIREADLDLFAKDGCCVVTMTVPGTAFINLMRHLGECGILSVLCKIDSGALISFGALPWAPIGRLMRDVFTPIFFNRLHSGDKRAEFKRKVVSAQSTLDSICLPKVNITKLKNSLVSDEIEVARYAIDEMYSRRKQFKDVLLKAKQNKTLNAKALASLIACESKFLYWLATKGFWQSYYQWLRRGVNFDVNMSNQEGITALMLACRAELRSVSNTSHVLNVLKHLVIERGVDINQVDSIGNGALALASTKGHLDIARQLVGMGCRLNECNQDGYTSLHLTCQEGHLQTAKFLISSGADVEAKNKFGRTPLLEADFNKRYDVVAALRGILDGQITVENEKNSGKGEGRHEPNLAMPFQPKGDLVSEQTATKTYAIGGTNKLNYARDFLPVSLQNTRLPSLPKSFCGREELSEKVVNAVEQKIPVCWLWGPPGCGKSAVAINVVHKLNEFGTYSLPMCLEDPKNVEEVEEFIAMHIKRAEPHKVYSVFFIDNCNTMSKSKNEDSEEKLIKAIKKLSETYTSAFTVLVTTYGKPSELHNLNINPIRVPWPDRTESAQLLASRCAEVDMNAIKDHKLTRPLVLYCCNRMPLAIITVASAVVASTAVEKSLREQHRCFRARHSLFKDFCENFDADSGVLRRCFENFYEYLSSELQDALRCLSVLTGTFSKNCGKTYLDDTVNEGKITRLWMRGILEIEGDKSRYFLPELFRQYVLTRSDYFDTHQRARAAYCKYLKKVMDQIRTYCKDKKAGKALMMFKGIKKKLEGYLEDTASVENDDGKILVLAICTMDYVKVLLLEYASPSAVSKFCDSCLKSPNFNEIDRLRVSLFYAEVLFHQSGRPSPSRIRKSDELLSKCKIYLKSRTLSKDKKRTFTTQYLITLVELCLVKGTSLGDEDLAKLEKQKRLQHRAARLAAAKARFQLGVMSYGKDLAKAHGHLSKAAKYFRECRDELGLTDCSRCLHQMWIGDCLFQKGEYKDALDVFKNLLKEVDEVVWPGEGIESKDRRNIRLSAIYYAQGLCQTLHSFCDCYRWDANQLRECLGLFELSLKHIPEVYSSPLLYFIYLAKGKLHLLLHLHEILCGNEHTSNHLKLATQCFERVVRSCVNDRTRQEASSFEKICNAYGSGSDGVAAEDISNSAKVFVTAEGGVVKSQKIFKACKRNEASDPYKSPGRRLFANSAMYLDLDGVREREQREIVTPEKENFDDDDFFEFCEEDKKKEEFWWEENERARTEFADDKAADQLAKQKIVTNCFLPLSVFKQHELSQNSESRGNTNTVTQFDTGLSEWKLSPVHEETEGIDQRTSFSPTGVGSQSDESSFNERRSSADPPTMPKSPEVSCATENVS